MVNMPDKTWKKIKAELGENIPQHAINTWFEPIRPIILSKNELVVEVPNQFFYEWIESHYKPVSYTHLTLPTNREV